MKKSNHSAIRYQFLLVILFLVQFAQAQPAFDDGDDVNDAVPAPIDDWILPMAIIGIVVMYYFIKKKRQSLV
ncbi:hypothetical protein [Flavobacterium sp.]|jgi:hypothetical protein|uniref:hypothetical protein n=1 Tax=Flavobacterium sp. TaxID=239 RepID=UPI0037C19B45